MEFVAVVLGIMAISLMLIHWLTNRLGCRMKYRSLLLCGLLAFAVNMAAIRFSPYLTQGHYIRLGLMVLVASAIVTFYNERLVRREDELAATAGGVVFPSHEGSDAPDEAAALETEADPAEGLHGGEPVPAPSAEDVVQPEELPESEDTGTEIVSEEKTSEPGDSAVETVPESEPAKPVEPLKALESMDDFLDYAFEQQSKGNALEAIAAYRAALERYAEDGYAPFIAIDLGNIYKNRADYDAAIQVYEDALDLPAVVRSDGTYQEFVKNLSYLRIVREVLARHNALEVPFSQIAPACMDEIEAEFQAQ